MSSKNSSKKLLGVYRRCLCALSQDFRLHPVTVEEEKLIAKQAVKDASEFEASELKEGRRAFANKDAKDKLINERTYRLWQHTLDGHFKDPRRAAKEQIQALVNSVDRF